MKLKLAVAFGLAVMGATIDRIMRTPVNETVEEESSIPMWYFFFVAVTITFFFALVVFI